MQIKLDCSKNLQVTADRSRQECSSTARTSVCYPAGCGQFPTSRGNMAVDGRKPSRSKWSA